MTLNISNPGDKASQLANALQEASLVRADITLTVGATGDFSTLGAAVARASSFPVAYKKDGITVEIRCLSGFKVEEQLFAKAIDLSFIRITSEDAVVEVDRSALTSIPDGAPDYVTTMYPVFSGIDRARLPIIDCLFDMNDSGAPDYRIGFLIAGSASLLIKRERGMLNCAHRGIHSMAGEFDARETRWDGAGTFSTEENPGAAVRASNGTRGNIRDSSMPNCHRGLVVEGSMINAQNLYAPGCGRAIFGSQSVINANRLDAPNCLETTVFTTGGYMSVQDSDITGAGFAQAARATGGGVLDLSNSRVKGTSDAYQASIAGGGKIIAIGTTKDGVNPIDVLVDSSGVFS